MREQLNSLVVWAKRSHIRVQVLPFTAGTHAGLDGPFILLRFAGPDPDIAYTEGMAGSVTLESLEDVARLRVAFEGIQQAALSEEESMEMIAAKARE
jgi:Domain of unknown function (DUF5753)